MFLRNFSHNRYTSAAPDMANKMRRIVMINPSTPPSVSAEIEFEALESFPWLSRALSWIVELSLSVVKTPSGCGVSCSLGCLFGALLGWITMASMQPPLGVYT